MNGFNLNKERTFNIDYPLYSVYRHDIKIGNLRKENNYLVIKIMHKLTVIETQELLTEIIKADCNYINTKIIFEYF